MKPTVHIGLSNAKCQDRTPLLFKSKLLHEITQSQLNLQRNCTGNLKSLDPMYIITSLVKLAEDAASNEKW
ncbi:hypothetical protein P8452_12940 [Trifolium repens]|nr:hypothetical protein P8452_12940 [Trifolium repens]